MRQISTLRAISKSVAFLLVVGITAYGARYALGGNDPHDTDAHSTLVASIADDGAEIYMTRCMSCHQMNGRGVPGVFPPLVDADWVTGDKGRLIRVVLNGLTGEIEVNGETYSGAMPPWNSFLNDDQTASLLTYIRSSWGNEASEVTAAEVSKVRAATKDRREPWTEDELKDEANMGIPGAETEDAAPKDSKPKTESKTGKQK